MRVQGKALGANVRNLNFILRVVEASQKAIIKLVFKKSSLELSCGNELEAKKRSGTPVRRLLQSSKGVKSKAQQS